VDGRVAEDFSAAYVAAAKTKSGVRRVDLPAIAALALAQRLTPASLLRRKASASAIGLSWRAWRGASVPELPAARAVPDDGQGEAVPDYRSRLPALGRDAD
jgi:hypothetical protein